MSLKDLTAEKHKAAESTAFMQAVFKGGMTETVWADWTYQKLKFYGILEYLCARWGHMNDLSALRREEGLRNDFEKMTPDKLIITRKTTHAYLDYLRDLQDRQLLAHVYVWHMGDLYGGQMIKRVLPNIPHESLDFTDTELLKNTLRAKLTDDLGDEANVAFDWAIKLLKEYDDYFHN